MPICSSYKDHGTGFNVNDRVITNDKGLATVTGHEWYGYGYRVQVALDEPERWSCYICPNDESYQRNELYYFARDLVKAEGDAR